MVLETINDILCDLSCFPNVLRPILAISGMFLGSCNSLAIVFSCGSKSSS